MASGSRTEESAIKLDVNITKLDDSSPVFFKVDGERFKETQTLKLQVDTTYKVSFEFRPSMEVSEISIAGVNVEHELKRSDERSSYHECAWSTTGMSHSKKKDRLYVVISIKFQDGKELNARVQCKMYSPKDKNHLVWGTCLKNLYMGCRVREGQSHIDVQQLVFK